MHKSSEIQNLQTELKYLDSFKCYWILTDSWGPPFGGVGVGGWGWDSLRMFGGCPMHMCTCTHACALAYMYKHDIFMQMPAPIGKSWGIPYDIIGHARACVCMCALVWGTPQHPDRVPPPSIHPHAPKWGTPGISQNSIALKLIEIFQFHLKIWNLWRISHPWVGV